MVLAYQDVAEVIHSTHAAMRNEFRWVSDGALYKRPEFWTTPARYHGLLYGDCEDWTFEILTRLGHNGIPFEFMYPVVCIVSRGPFDHCVAGIETDQGTLISCCNQALVQHRLALPYWAWHRPGGGGRHPITQPWEAF